MKNRTRAALPIVFAFVLAGAGMVFAGSLLAHPGAPAQAAAAKEAPAQAAPKLTAKSIEIDLLDPGDLPIPPEFRVAVYESLVGAVERSNKFEHVYRNGNKGAAGAPDLVILHTTAEAFKKGSEKQREVTSVSGFTDMKVKATFTDRSGKVLLEKELEGRVRFFGGNLNATYDIAKKLSTLIAETF